MNWFEVGVTGVAHLFPISVPLRRRSADLPACGLPVFYADLHRVRHGDRGITFCEYCRFKQFEALESCVSARFAG